MRLSKRLLAGSLALALLAACSSSSKTSSAASSSQAPALTGTPIKIMQIATLTGPSDNVPQDADAGKATAKAINDSGGISGHPIDLVVCDDKFDPNSAADCARQAVDQKVSAVIALNSAFGDKVIPVLEAAGIPSVGDNLITSAEFTSKIVYPITGGAITGSSAMAYAAAHAGSKKLRPVLVDVAAAKGLLPFIKQAAALFPSSELLTDVAVPAQAKDVTSEASAAAADGADSAFFVVGAGAGATLTQAMRTEGFTGTLVTSTQSITEQEIHDLGDQATGLLLVSAMPPAGYTQNASVKQFDEDMKKSNVPERSGGMLLAWATLQVIKQALTGATATDAAGLKTALDTHGEFKIEGLGQWDYSKPLQAFGGGALRIFNPFQYISKVDSSGTVTPIDPEPFDVTAAPTK